jgi:hypothetical protein
MSLVPALAELHAAHKARQARMGVHRPNVVSWQSVRRPEPVPEPVNDPDPDPVDLPDFLGMRARRDEWFDKASREAFKPASATVILRTVSVMTRTRLLDITSRRRDAPVVMPRQVACWIMRNFTGMSLPQIGQKLGGRDHTTVLHAIHKVEERRKDPDFAAFVDNIVDTVMEAMKGEPA